MNVCVLRTALSALLVIALATPAHAGRVSVGTAMRALRATATTARVYGRTSDGTYVLSASELAACLEKQRRLETSDATLDATAAAIESTESRLIARLADIERAAATLNQYDAAAVDRHNAKVRTLQGEAAALERKIAAFNQSVEELNTMAESFNANCAGRSYYTEDLPIFQ